MLVQIQTQQKPSPYLFAKDTCGIPCYSKEINPKGING